MKVTCNACKRRIKIKTDKPHVCKCGNLIDPFSPGKYIQRFREYDFSSIKDIGDVFMNGHSTDEMIEIIEFLKMSSMKEDSRKFALLSSIEVLRRFKKTNYMDLAWRVVNEWPRDFRIRYMIGNCLDLSEKREDHLEALKQRMIGTAIHCAIKRKKGAMTDEEFGKMLERHLNKLDEERKFLRGIKDHSCKKVEIILANQIDLPGDLADEIKELEHFWFEERVDKEISKEPKFTCVVDTNALSNRYSSRLFVDPRVEFIAPLDVLIELSKWGRIDKVPFELENVIIKEVHVKVPREIDRMFSKTKGLEPSHADKMVATLAFQENANAIISDDRDLWDSGLQYYLEKNYGISLNVIRPDNLERWIEKNT